MLEGIMNVEQAINTIAVQSSEAVLLAIPPREAKFVLLTSDCRVLQEGLEVGYKYLLGVDDMQHLLQAAARKRMGKKGSCRAYYSLCGH
jgi:hypothetical protein